MSEVKLKSIVVSDFVSQTVGNDYKSIPIGNITSISVSYSEQLWSLPTGIILVLIGITSMYATQLESQIGLILSVVGVSFVIYYLSTRKHVVSISSSTLKIEESTKGVSPALIKEFVSSLEQKIRGISGR